MIKILNKIKKRLCYKKILLFKKNNKFKYKQE